MKYVSIFQSETDVFIVNRCCNVFITNPDYYDSDFSTKFLKTKNRNSFTNVINKLHSESILRIEMFCNFYGPAFPGKGENLNLKGVQPLI